MKQRRHSWIKDDDGIEICRVCGLYRCTAPAVKNDSGGRPRKADVEYSLPDGEVIALNPDRVPDCAV